MVYGIPLPGTTPPPPGSGFPPSAAAKVDPLPLILLAGGAVLTVTLLHHKASSSPAAVVPASTAAASPPPGGEFRLSSRERRSRGLQARSGEISSYHSWWPRDESGRFTERCTGPRSRCERERNDPRSYGLYRLSATDFPPVVSPTLRGWRAQARDGDGKVVATVEAPSRAAAVDQALAAAGQTTTQHGYGRRRRGGR